MSSQPGPAPCELCAHAGGEVLWRDDKCRFVLVADPDYAGYCRVIWNAHVKEMTDLAEADRLHCMRAVLAAERALRNVLNPHKINLAAFGNMTPHLHWHVIAREAHDAHFPQPVWGARQRDVPPAKSPAALKTLAAQLASEFSKFI